MFVNLNYGLNVKDRSMDYADTPYFAENGHTLKKGSMKRICDVKKTFYFS